MITNSSDEKKSEEPVAAEGGAAPGEKSLASASTQSKVKQEIWWIAALTAAAQIQKNGVVKVGGSPRSVGLQSSPRATRLRHQNTRNSP